MKHFLFIGFCIILFLGLTSSVSASLIAYYSLNNTLSDSVGSCSLTNSVSSVTFVNNPMYFNTTGSMDYVAYADGDIADTSCSAIQNIADDYSVSFWVNTTSYDLFDTILGRGDWGTDGAFFFRLYGANNGLLFEMNGPSTPDTNKVICDTVIDDGDWHHIVGRFRESDNNMGLWVDGVECNSVTHTNGNYAYATDFGIGGRPAPNDRFFTGYLSTLRVYDSFLNDTAISGLYNCNNETYCLPKDNFTITAINGFDSESLTNFSAYLNNTLFSTTNGIIVTDVLKNASSTYNIELSSDQDGGYFNKTYNAYDVSSNLEASLYQAQINITATEYLTENTLFGVFKNESGSTLTLPMFINAGNYSFVFENASYYSKTKEFNISNRFNGTLVIDDVSSSLINITVKNAYTDVALNNFSGWVYNIDQDHNSSFSTTTGYYESPAINGNYTIFVEAEGYAISQDTNYLNVSVNSTLENTSFGLYSNNSVRIKIFDEDTNLKITGTNITITVTGDVDENQYSTTSGEYFLDNLTDGDYSFKFSGGNYTLKTYVVSVADRSTQSLNVYLASNTQSVIFTISDSLSSSSIESVSFTASRLINGSWTVTDSKLTDVTGRVQLNYIPNVKYRFSATKTGYVSKVFELDPVIFGSYDILLTPIVSNPEIDYYNVDVVYYPKSFIDGVMNNLTFSFISSTGSLESYGLTINYPGGSVSRGGDNAIGEDFDINFSISGSLLLDTVNITYWYDSVFSSNKTFYAVHSIGGGSNNLNNSWLDLKENEKLGLGVLELGLISLFFVILLAGFGFMLGGLKVSAVIMSLGFGLFSFLGFLPLWSVLPALLVAFVIFAGGES